MRFRRSGQRPSGDRRTSLALKSTPTPLLWLAVLLGPPLVTVALLVPAFRVIQDIGMPRGELTGIDLTPFAVRDQVVFWCSGLLLMLLTLMVARRAPNPRTRIALSIAGIVATIGSMLIFLSLTFAG